MQRRRSLVNSSLVSWSRVQQAEPGLSSSHNKNTCQLPSYCTSPSVLGLGGFGTFSTFHTS